MVTYCFETPRGNVIERLFRMGKAPKFVRLGGIKCFRSFQAEGCGALGTKRVHCRPSLDLGVHPRQIGELQRLLKSRGVRDTQFDARTGDCLVENRTHRNEILKARGMRNEWGGHGDWCGK